jgi:acetylornithine/N-succinyldiaminopimelate aminotransferase
MSSDFTTQAKLLLSSPKYQAAKNEIVKLIAEASAGIRKVKPSPSSPEAREAYAKAIQDFVQGRGRELYYPYLSAGLGSGPFVELLDGSVKYDMITGIGINFFGHSHPALIAEMIDALPADTMQGNLQPGHEAKALIETIVKKAAVGSRIAHGWLMCSGTMSNEVALKIIRQKKYPATKIMAFRDCFAGRSTAMQEITDNPGYRQGQPVYGEVYYLSFYDAKLGLEASIARTLGEMKEHLTRYPDKFAALMMEPVQGEGGFNVAPRDYLVRVFEEAKKAGLAIWLDEVQTFGRTGEFFAYQKLCVGEYVDVVTIGKLLQACMVLYTAEYNPKPGLVAGTFSGSTVALRTGRKILEMLSEEGFLGPEGKIEQLSAQFAGNLRKLAESSCKGTIGEIRAFGGMIAFEPFGGTMDDVKAVLMKLFDMGLVAFYCGHGPYFIRTLAPLGAMTQTDVNDICGIIEKALLSVKEDKANQQVKK